MTNLEMLINLHKRELFLGVDDPIGVQSRLDALYVRYRKALTEYNLKRISQFLTR